MMTHFVGKFRKHYLKQIQKGKKRYQSNWTKWNKISERALGQTEKEKPLNASYAATLRTSQESNLPHRENTSRSELKGKPSPRA